MLNLSDGIGNLGGIQWGLLISLLIAWVVVGAALIKGVKSSGKVRRMTGCCSDTHWCFVILYAGGGSICQLQVLKYPGFGDLISRCFCFKILTSTSSTSENEEIGQEFGPITPNDYSPRKMNSKHINIYILHNTHTTPSS